VQEVRWDKGGTVRAGDYDFFFTGKEMKIVNWEQIFLYIVVCISSEESRVC